MEAIVLEGVSKRFRRYTLKTYTTLKSAVINWILSRNPGPKGEYIEALKDITLSVKPGTTVGIIGRNGSGKSTLLKLVAGIMKPDSGRIRTNGRISSIIGLGAGFHPEFTGRENIYINGVILGLTKREIRDKFDQIVKFAELEEFIDAPVRTYSSGMYARLGFSIAVNVDPDILLVDEVLAVGDQAFQKRCLDRMTEFKRSRKTILIVTHNLDFVSRWCDEVLWLDRGQNMAYGDPARSVRLYKSSLSQGDGRPL